MKKFKTQYSEFHGREIQSWTKVQKGWYDLGNTGHEVRQALSGETKGQWYHINYDGEISKPFDTARDAKSTAECAVYGG